MIVNTYLKPLYKGERNNVYKEWRFPGSRKKTKEISEQAFAGTKDQSERQLQYRPLLIIPDILSGFSQA